MKTDRDLIGEIMKSFKLKGPFLRPLRCGDYEQIMLLKVWRSEIERIEEQCEARERGELRKFRVNYSYRVEDAVEVEALDKDEAEEVALDQIFQDDVEIESVTDVGPVSDGRPITKAA